MHHICLCRSRDRRREIKIPYDRHDLSADKVICLSKSRWRSYQPRSRSGYAAVFKICHYYSQKLLSPVMNFTVSLSFDEDHRGLPRSVSDAIITWPCDFVTSKCWWRHYYVALSQNVQLWMGYSHWIWIAVTAFGEEFV